MADVASVTGPDAAVSFMVSAGIVYEIIAAACSSPQTTEINAGARSETLMKWVWIGLAQAGLFVAIAAMLSNRPWAVILGGALAAAVMLASYIHARRAGLRSNAPGTEQY